MASFEVDYSYQEEREGTLIVEAKDSEGAEKAAIQELNDTLPRKFLNYLLKEFDHIMANTFETLEGELNWVRTQEPETYMDKSSWKVQLRPTQESLMKIMDLQSLGVKNQLKKVTDDRGGYTINFSRPTERKNKRGEVIQRFEPPKVFKEDGVTPLEDLIGNGSKGRVTLELYQHPTPNGGKAHAARLYSIAVTELVPHVPASDLETAQNWN